MSKHALTDSVSTPGDCSRRGSAVTRREFMFILGGGAAICGYFLLRGAPGIGPPSPGARTASASACPKLRPDLVVQTEAEFTTLRLSSSPGPAICGVNETGVAVLDLLDGEHAVEDIATRIADQAGVAAGDELTARIAGFVAALAENGFLCDPYFVNIYERVLA